ncbi:hypothetical protein [Halococcus sediminicola]|uniref:hypothetical protein n=1 Tax=Halococcus sediminicola TaxID=1264579 RepID=UPI00067908A7|nr:hypothetical protein [Halococcus sediminicola]
MEWLSVSGRTLLYTGVLFLFFWTLIGQYVYREAKREQRSSPQLRGLGWGVLGIIGVFGYLANIKTGEKNRLWWLGLSLLLFVFWAAEPLIQQGPPGWYAWAGFYAGLFILYWQFDLEPLDDSGTQSGTG